MPWSEMLLALLSLSALEIVLGVDNLVFIAIAVGRLPRDRRSMGRKLGLLFACFTRIALLVALNWLAGMDDAHMPLFELFGRTISVRDLVLGAGGLFLVVKGLMEIRAALAGEEPAGVTGHAGAAGLALVVAQIALIDIVFSIDSVIVAVGMVNNVPVMAGAIVLAVLVMLLAADPVGEFIDANPTVRMLALAFIVLIGVALLGESVDLAIPKGGIYGAMAFAAAVEALNRIAARRHGR